MLVKPQTPIINWGNSLTTSLTFDLAFNEKGGSPRDTVKRRVGTSSNTTWDSGANGPMLDFNGTSTSVSFLNSTDNAIFTYQAVIYLAGSGTSRTVKSNFTDPNGIQFKIDTSNRLDLVKMSAVDVGHSTGTLSTGTWYNVFVSYDAAGVLKFYINGILDSTQTNLQTFTTNSSIWIGRHQSATAEWFNGNMALFRMWNRVLTDTEIKQLYTDPWRIYKRNFFQTLNSIAAAVGSWKIFGDEGMVS